MNPFTISHRYPPLAGAPVATGGSLLHVTRTVFAGRGGVLRLRAKGSAESQNVVVSSRRKVEKQAVLEEEKEEEVGTRPVMMEARSGEELISYVRKKVESGKLSPEIVANLEELYFNYRNAVMQSGNPKSHEIILHNMAVAFDRMLLDAEDPFTFPPLHKAIREPFDYYTFGQNYIRPLVDFRNSYVGNIHIFQEMEEKLQQGDNVILMSNHQSEADPAIIALLLERTHPRISENIVYIAGDRVVTDLLCKPFSMGRNLICVYSKKHMNDEPELIEMKRRANTRSLKEMAMLLRGGSQIIWIAPSGGRDRPDPKTEEWHPAEFDASSVDNMRRLSEHCDVTGHIYPLAMLCYDVMPPPPQVEKQIGEKRKISFSGVGISIGSELNYKQITNNQPEQGREVFCEALYSSVKEQYNVLKSAIYGNNGLDASTDSISLSQPWLFS